MRDAEEAPGAENLIRDVAVGIGRADAKAGVLFTGTGIVLSVATCGMEGAGTYAVVPAQLLRQAFRAMSRPLNEAELRRYSLSSHCDHVTRWNSEHPPFAGNQ